MRELDHIVIAHPNLDLAIEEFADLTGCKPEYGGPHVGGGTHNALVSLGESVYIELISPDPAQRLEQAKGQTSNLGQRLADCEAGTLLAWAIRSDSLDTLSAELSGFEANTPFNMSREQPNGEVLNWRLMNLVKHDMRGFAPFFIDWLECPHPSANNPVGGEFVSFTISHTDLRLGKVVGETDGVDFVEAEPSMKLEFESKKGRVVFSHQSPQGFWT